MDQGCDESRLRLSFRHALQDMFEGAGAAGCYYGDSDIIGNATRQLQVIAGLGAIRIHARQQDLAGAAARRLLRPPADGARARGRAPAMDVDLPPASVLPPLAVDGDHDALAPE